MQSTREILERLVAFPTVSAATNLPLIDWVRAYLAGLGAVCEDLPDATGTKAGLLARIGPARDGGVLLSAHSDVVPVEGQSWSYPPFRLTEVGGRLFGRGATDMKGFLASALHAAGLAARQNLARPLLLSVSYDEEVGCLGIRAMIDRVVPVLGRPAWCLVGEPTGLRIAIGHKGKAAYRATCRGQAGHSSLAPQFVNALHLAADVIGALRAEQSRLLREGAREADYDVPTSTVHAGRMAGGVALNMVPETATVDFEIRHLAAEPAEVILKRIEADAARIVATAGAGAAIGIERVNAYPGLATKADAAVVGQVAALLDAPALIRVAYGTEAGFFAGLGIPTVVCGPGSMAQGHQPDEFLDAAELDRCDAMMARLVAGLAV